MITHLVAAWLGSPNLWLFKFWKKLVKWCFYLKISALTTERSIFYQWVFFFFFLTYLFISIFALSDKFPNILELGIHKNSQICKRRKSRHKQLAYINSRKCNSFILFRKKIQDEAIKYIYIYIYIYITNTPYSTQSIGPNLYFMD